MSALDRLKDRPAATGDAVFAYDPQDAVTLSELRETAKTARSTADRTNLPADKRDAREAQTKADEFAADIVTVTFTAAPVGGTRLAQLEAEHPPTDAQIERLQAAEDRLASVENREPRPMIPEWDTDTYPAALLSESIVKVTISDDPDHPIDGLTIEDARAVFDGMTKLDQLQLLGLCTSINFRASRISDLGKG